MGMKGNRFQVMGIGGMSKMNYLR